MLKCWAKSPTERPAFVDLVGILSTSLDFKAGYLDVTAFSGHQPSIVTSQPEHAGLESIQDSPACEIISLGPHAVKSSPRQSLQNLYINKN